ncbi:TRAP transporter substrate-binding protein [Arthrobacter sp. zg-ZUI100]|uniref:TRAP transporter substrate-binding protein n=1 Tax=Arthrobacter jiangjiafuii TaxID=2817475 RepID=UPI001AEF151B|nr:TRAP transporter substrate-binding protein [Arthrobacter jiangjiafuii]MBP3037532.1 TRAP transporter substrate-binding protein [Arthrobacter jiangjiafuii]MBP3037550.1 TRAP transporter substrate-binding protein [Arthrobacter jiangjiafuii]
MESKNTHSARPTRSALKALTMAAVIGFALTGCGGGAAGDNSGSRQLLLGHGADPSNPRSEAAEFFSNQVAELTDDQLTVQVQGSEQLGSDAEMMVSLSAGTLDLTANSQGAVSSSVPEMALFGLPFLFESSEHAYEVVDGPIGDEVALAAESAGFKVLSWWDNGIRDITNSKMPIETPGDVAGLKVRTPEDPMTIDIFNALKANPTPLAFNELYLALQQGAVDGQENPITNIASSKLHEVQAHLARTGHKYEVTPFIISMSTWESLSTEQQEAVQSAANEARDMQRALMVERSEELYAELEGEIAITTPELEPFRSATADVYDKWSEKFPDLVEQFKSEADSNRAEFASE